MKSLAFALSLAAATAVIAVPTTAGAVVYVFKAVLDGPSESPSNASPGTGTAKVVWDTTAHTAHITSSFSGLTGTTTASHIHAPTTVAFTGTAPVATQTPSFIGFPLGVTAGVFDNTYDTDVSGTYRAGFITSSGGTVGGAEAALLDALLSGKAYYNIHTSTFGGGEIRGFLTLAVPEPSTWALMIAGFGLAGAGLRRRRAAA